MLNKHWGKTIITYKDSGAFKAHASPHQLQDADGFASFAYLYGCLTPLYSMLFLQWQG